MNYLVQEEDGLFAISTHPEAFRYTALALHGLQHRGKDYLGIYTRNQRTISELKHIGQAADILANTAFDRVGDAAIGQVKFSRESTVNIQTISPWKISCSKGDIALSFSGNITNMYELRSRLIKEGSVFQSDCQNETLLHLIAQSTAPSAEDAVRELLTQLEGAFCLAVLTSDQLILARDVFGYRPLMMGIKPIDSNQTSYVFASETCAFDLIGATVTGEVGPGEIITISHVGHMSVSLFSKHAESRRCVRELSYLARPDSIVFSKINGVRDVNDFRERLGGTLAQEHPIDGDVVLGMPDDGTAIALGYSSATNIPYGNGLTRNHYGIPRTSQALSAREAKEGRLNANHVVVNGKKVILIVNQLLKGSSAASAIKKLRAKGAQSVTLLIATPPTMASCQWGVDLPVQSELIAISHTLEEIKTLTGADYLGYISLESFIGMTKTDFCHHCFTGTR